MASTWRSNRPREAAIQEDERWPWMNMQSEARVSGGEGETHRCRQKISTRRSSTSVWGFTSERKFDELILAINGMARAITSMDLKMTEHWQEIDELDRHHSPP